MIHQSPSRLSTIIRYNLNITYNIIPSPTPLQAISLWRKNVAASRQSSGRHMVARMKQRIALAWSACRHAATHHNYHRSHNTNIVTLLARRLQHGSVGKARPSHPGIRITTENTSLYYWREFIELQRRIPCDILTEEFIGLWHTHTMSQNVCYYEMNNE